MSETDDEATATAASGAVEADDDTTATAASDAVETGRKTVLITGCSSGIGRATARAFLDDSWRVYATARDTDDIADLAEAGCATHALDVTDDDQVRSVVEDVIADAGRIDCLVNNAGYGHVGPVEEVPIEEVHRQFDVNVYGPHRLLRAVLPHMRDRGAGKIVNVSSVIGRVSMPGTGVYSGSKFALEAISDALRSEVADHGIDVAVVEPGPVETNFAETAEQAADRNERSGAYEWFYDVFEDTQLIGGSGPGAVPPERVAETILEAANSPNPAARYPVGTVAEFGVKARFLPDSIRDALYGIVRKLG